VTTSPGRATAARALTEAALERKALQSYRRFLRESTAAGSTWQAWSDHADRMTLLFGQRFPSMDPTQIHFSLISSGVPDEALLELAAGTNLLPRSRPAWGVESLYRWLRTEATATQNSTSMAALAAAGYTSKRWISHHDKLVRPSHLAANGQTVPMSASFSVGSSSLLYPGDPMGSPGERENCRCVLVGV